MFPGQAACLVTPIGRLLQLPMKGEPDPRELACTGPVNHGTLPDLPFYYLHGGPRIGPAIPLKYQAVAPQIRRVGAENFPTAAGGSMMQTLQAPLADSSVPRKLFYRINEVSKITGLKPYVLRYWESEFPELSPEKDASDQRRYRARDIETVQAIRKLLYEDRFTIKGARQRLKSELKRHRKSAESGSDRSSAPATPSDAAIPAERNSRLGETLYHLRNEVDELLKILGT